MLLPCFAHDETTLRTTLEAFRAALQFVAASTHDGSIDRRIRIPLLGEM